MPYTPGPGASANALLFQGWLDGLENLDVPRMMDLFDETAVQETLPASLGRPQKNKREYEAHIRTVIPIFENSKVVIHDFTESADKIVVHASWLGNSKLGTPYNNEYILYFDFCESTTGEGGRKICRMRQFIDSGYTTEWFSKEHAKRGKPAAEKAWWA